MNTLHEDITTHPFFSGLDAQALEAIAGGAVEAEFEPGQILFREGEPANKFYLIQSGRILLEAHERADGTVPIEEIGPGDVLGWSWLFQPFAWHLQARAMEPSRAIVLSGAKLLVMAEQNRTFGYELMKRIAQVVIHRLHETRKKLIAARFETILHGEPQRQFIAT